MSSETAAPAAPQPDPNLVNIVIDGKALQVKKGQNIIEAAKQAGVDIPFYCYHPHLSIAGNCRMCQIQVKGQPKLTIACNTTAQEGMDISTHFSNKEVADTQASTLEMILINHPLDCTVCDQAGHCKLQDYHYQYNARPSRFLKEDKEHKPKAVPLGPTVMLDGERCIMCSRCVRFCDEVTGTSELGLINRGDKTVIAVSPGKELNNPFSGTVVDLCPVGALTHRKWRFNTRIWFTKQADSVCPGCSTGCSVKVASRDGKIVNVKARLNDDVNKEWLCDEGRYSFNGHIPENRLVSSKINGSKVPLGEAISAAAGFNKEGKTLLLLSPTLLAEDIFSAKRFLDAAGLAWEAAVAFKPRTLTKLEAILISPDYAANFKSLNILGLNQKLINENHAVNYSEAISRLKLGQYTNVFLVGDRSVLDEDCNQDLQAALKDTAYSMAVFTNDRHPLSSVVKILIPGRTYFEKSGTMINGKSIAQYTQACIDAVNESNAEWKIFKKLFERTSGKLLPLDDDRSATIDMLGLVPALNSLSIGKLKKGVKLAQA